VISLLLKSWPDAIQVKGTHDETPLHAVCINRAPFDTIALLLRAWPDAVKEKDRDEQTPLFLACEPGASLDVISLLLEYCPDAIKMKNRNGQTPLHVACMYAASLDNISLLLNTWPGASNEKDSNDDIPFSIACYLGRPLEILLLLLDAWLELPGNRNSDRVNSLINDAPRHIRTRPFRVSSLFGDELSVTSQEELMSYFISIKWQKGALLAINKYPSYVKNMDLHTEVMADFLSLAGRYCSLTTMWEVIINEQELLKGVKCL